MAALRIADANSLFYRCARPICLFSASNLRDALTYKQHNSLPHERIDAGFWATVCKTVRLMLSDRSLSVCLPVCLSCPSALSSGCPLSRGNAEALRPGGKAEHRLISCFLSNASAKYYRNWIVYSKIIGSQRWDVF